MRGVPRRPYDAREAPCGQGRLNVKQMLFYQTQDQPFLGIIMTSIIDQ